MRSGKASSRPNSTKSPGTKPRSGRSQESTGITTSMESIAVSAVKLLCFLPQYEERPRERYPVLYLHDGQNLFDAATAFGNQEWGVDEAAEELIAAGAIQPLIIVGIHNAGEQRLEEYTHVRNRKGQGGR